MLGRLRPRSRCDLNFVIGQMAIQLEGDREATECLLRSEHSSCQFYKRLPGSLVQILRKYQYSHINS